MTATHSPPESAEFDLDARWAVHSQVSIRPEPFGALLYHFGTRKLSFLKDPRLLLTVRGLADHADARSSLTAAGVTAAELPAFRTALARLYRSDMLVRQPVQEDR
jgi:putative mycofactocin binding protein MftB